MEIKRRIGMLKEKLRKVRRIEQQPPHFVEANQRPVVQNKKDLETELEELQQRFEVCGQWVYCKLST